MVLTWLVDAPQVLCTFCPLTGAFPSRGTSDPDPEVLHHQPQEAVVPAFQEHVCKVVPWTSVFILYIIYNHSKKWSASWSFSVSFGHMEQMGFPDARITLAAFQQFQSISLKEHLMLIYYRPHYTTGSGWRGLDFGRNVTNAHLMSFLQHPGLKRESVLHSSSLHPGSQKFSTHPGFGELGRQFQGRAEPPLILIFLFLAPIKPFIKLY